MIKIRNSKKLSRKNYLNIPYAAYDTTTKTLAKKKIMPKTFQFYTKTSFVASIVDNKWRVSEWHFKTSEIHVARRIPQFLSSHTACMWCLHKAQIVKKLVTSFYINLPQNRPNEQLGLIYLYTESSNLFNERDISMKIG